MKPGHLVVIGAFCIAIGLSYTVSWLCIASGVFCLYFGITGLIRESKEEKGDDDERIT